MAPNPVHKVLVVEDSDATRELLQHLFVKEGFEVKTAENGLDAATLLSQEAFHCVVTDLRMPKMSGEDLCKRVFQMECPPPVVVLTAYGTIPNAVEHIKNGAFDYVLKPFSNDDLLERVRRACEKKVLDDQVQSLRSQIPMRRYSDYLIGNSEPITRILQQINSIAKNDVTVLVTGESGTGKELVARTIHMASNRQNKKFVTVNCGAIPENLMESELFGHVKGAFTGAVSDKPGLFEEAHEGTIFLDEIGDMPLNLQVKLLRVLQESEIRRVGGNQSRKIDVRVITATNKELKREVDAKAFREDLFYRINVFPIVVPPLRDRREDVALLAIFFVELFNKELHLNVQGFTPPALKKMMRYRWPGNIRELQNKVKQAMIISRKKMIGPEDIMLQLPAETEDQMSFKEAKKKFEREYLISVLKITSGNITEASRIARKDRKDFYDVMKKYDLSPDDFRNMS